MNNGDNQFHENGFFGFALRYIGIIAAILAIGLTFAFSTGRAATLFFTLAIALMFFVILMMRWDTYKRGAMFTLTAVCVNVEHISRFRTDYVFESVPEDETSEPKIFILAEKRTKFKKYHQGVPYVMVFGTQKNCRELTSENLVTVSRRVERCGGGRAGRGYVDLDTLADNGSEGQETRANAGEEHLPSQKPKFIANPTHRMGGDDL